jgi:hypothetical protein
MPGGEAANTNFIFGPGIGPTIYHTSGDANNTPLRRNKTRKRVTVFNVTFNNISLISWHSVLFVEETGVLRENNRPVSSH